MAYLHFGNYQISYEQLRTHIPENAPEEQGEVLHFCQAWLRGEDSFTRKTSGSTGQPKLIRLSRKQMEASARQTLEFLQLTPSDCALVAIPTAFIGGTMMLVRALEMNMPALIAEASGNPFAELPADWQPTFTALVPLQLEKILHDQTSRKRFENCQRVLIGGAAVSPALEAACATLSNEVYNTYGMTETVSHVALRQISGTAEAYFRLLPRLSMRTDNRQCLAVCGAVTENVWIQTNDVVEIQSATQFRWLGRVDSVINSGGIKIYPEGIEEKIAQVVENHRSGSHFCISAVPSELLGEALVFVCEGKPWPIHEQQALMAAIKEILPLYHAPKQMVFIPVFPLTTTGKIKRQELKHALR